MPKLSLIVKRELSTLTKPQVTVFRRELEKRLPDLVRAAGEVARQYKKGSETNVS